MAKRGGVVFVVSLVLLLCLIQCRFFADAVNHRRRGTDDDFNAETSKRGKAGKQDEKQDSSNKGVLPQRESRNGTSIDKFIKEIEKVDREANLGVEAEREKLVKRQAVLDKIQNAKDHTNIAR